MSKPRKIDTDKAPAAIGPYSQALAIDNLVFTSGQLPLNPASGDMPSDIKAQAAQALDNLKAVLEAAGSGLDRVLKVTVYLADINDFAAINGVYEQYFTAPYPARSCFAVKALPKAAGLEIEAVAML